MRRYIKTKFPVDIYNHPYKEILKYTTGPMHIHQELEINLITQGHCQYIINDEYPVNLQTGDIFIAAGGTHHQLVPGTEVEFDIIYIHPELFEINLNADIVNPQLISSLSQWKNPLPPIVMTNKYYFRTLTDICRQWRVEKFTGSPNRDLYLDAMIKLLVYFTYRIFCEINPKANTKAEKKVIEVCEWMKQHFGERIYADNLAAIAGLSLVHFNAVFKKLYNDSPRAYLHKLRMNNAATMIAQSDEIISHIAFTCGFTDIPHFNRSFQKEFGMPPTEYRRVNGRQTT